MKNHVKKIFNTKILGLCALSMMIVACGGEGDGSTTTPNQLAQSAGDQITIERSVARSTIADIAQADGRFTTLLTALESTGLDAVVADENKTLTVFAPTDEAFNLLPDGTLEMLLSEEGLSTLQDILLYHVVEDAAILADTAISVAIAGEGMNTVTMANGDDIFLALSDNQELVIEEMPLNAKVIITDIIADNGVIHVIDTVLSPPMDSAVMSEADRASDQNTPEQSLAEMTEQYMESVMMGADTNEATQTCTKANTFTKDSLINVLKANDHYSTLVSLLESTGLDFTLKSTFKEFTVFAPTDVAFEQLFESLGDEATQALSNDVEALKNILLYHVISGQQVEAATAISIAQSETPSDRFVGATNDKLLELSFDNNHLFVNQAKVVCPNISTLNGIIHQIDSVLEIPGNVDVTKTISMKPNLSLFFDLVSSVGDLDHLLAIEHNVTVFAPSNEAIKKLGPQTLKFLENNPEQLLDILKQHIVVQQGIGEVAIDSATAFQSDGAELITALGGTLTVKVTEGVNDMGMYDTELFIEESKVTEVDIKATNGIIHVLDSVIVHVQ